MTRERLQEGFDVRIDRKMLQCLMAEEYSFATWRLPNEGVSYLLMDLGAAPLKDQDLLLEELNDCFIINPFKRNHPPTPKVLNGDIIITRHQDQTKVKVAPHISAVELEKFQETISRVSSSSLPRKQPSKDLDNDFISTVQKAIAEIDKGHVHKIVVSRFEDFKLSEQFDVDECFLSVANAYPKAFVYMAYTKEYGLWMGASPERLISIEDNKNFMTESLAGTQYLPEETDLSEVAWTQKEIEEQAMVSRYIIDCLKKIRLREFQESGPKTVRAGNLVHLKTEYRVDMEETNMPELGSIMLGLLHPTSAVCGSPFQPAYDFILAHEGYDRSLYSGFLGPVNFKNKTSLFVNLRCMQLFDGKARLYAGAGVTEDSHPEKEMQETVNKMRTLKDLL